MKPEELIRMTMEEAAKAVQEGNTPFGVVVLDPHDTLVWKDHDRSRSLMDPTAHGEINAIRGLCKKLQIRHLQGYKFYTNAQPCTLCMAAMIRTKVAEIYYGAKTESTASLPIPVEELAQRATKHTIKTYGGILAKETQEQIETLTKI